MEVGQRIHPIKRSRANTETILICCRLVAVEDNAKYSAFLGHTFCELIFCARIHTLSTGHVSTYFQQNSALLMSAALPKPLVLARADTAVDCRWNSSQKNSVGFAASPVDCPIYIIVLYFNYRYL